MNILTKKTWKIYSFLPFLWVLACIWGKFFLKVFSKKKATATKAVAVCPKISLFF